MKILQAFAACVDVVPLFLKTACDLQIDDGDLVVSPPLIEQSGTKPTICIQHIPTGIQVQSSGVYFLCHICLYC